MKSEKKELRVDVAGVVSELEQLLKKVLPRNILWKIVLGKGLEFDGYRDYTYSDDSSLIDWRASIRSQKTLVKRYVEERDLKFLFFIDVSDNMVFGSKDKLKCEYVGELVSALAHLVAVSGDRFGFVLYNSEVVKMKAPDVGTRQFELLVHELVDPENYGGVSELHTVLDSFIQTLDPSTSMVFLISDFVRVNEEYYKNFELLSNLVETTAIIVRDPLDRTLPNVNKELTIEDPESGERLLINPKISRNIYEKYSLEQLNRTKKLFRENHIDFLELSTDESFPEQLAEFLNERIRGGRKTRLKNVS